MSKFDKRAKELLDRVQSLMDAFELRKGTSGWPDYYEASREIKLQYPDLLIDVQTLLFCDSPEHPLYIQAKELQDPKKLATNRFLSSFSYSDFEALKDILLKYIEYRTFLEAED